MSDLLVDITLLESPVSGAQDRLEMLIIELPNPLLRKPPGQRRNAGLSEELGQTSADPYLLQEGNHTW